MAPAPEAYFPLLEKCLKGETIVLSWQLTAAALSDISGCRQTSPEVAELLSNAYVQQFFLNPLLAFAPPNNETKSEFETRTSPVNVTPATNGSYDIEAIKKHTLWLSENAKLNLIAALRIVTIEFQSRPALHLAGPLSSQDMSNLRIAAGLEHNQDSVLLSMLSAGGLQDAETLWTDFQKEEAIRRRIFSTYLAERKAFMLVSDYVFSVALYGCLPIHVPLRNANLPELYGCASMKQEDSDRLIKTYFTFLQDVIKRSDAGLGDLVKDEALLVEPVMLEWLRTLLTELAHILSIAFQIIDSIEAFAPAVVVAEWFSLMALHAYLDKLEPIDDRIAELIPPIHLLVSIISLTLLRPTESLMYLGGDADELPQSDKSYLCSPDVLETIQASIVQAVNLNCETTCPIIFAWTLIVHRMHISFNERSERRDYLLDQSARESFETSKFIRPAPGRRNSGGSMLSIEPRRFDNFLSATGLDKDIGDMEELARSVTAKGKAFDIVTGLTGAAAGFSHTGLSSLLSHRARVVYLDFLKASYSLVGYQADPVTCLVSVLASEQHLDGQPQSLDLAFRESVTDVALQDDFLMEMYFQQSLTRFPYEFLPFIKLCRVLCPSSIDLPDNRSDRILNLLRRTPTLTFEFPHNFQKFEMPVDDDNENACFLTENLPLIFSPDARPGRRHAHADDFRLSAGTRGRFVADSGRVVVMNYQHSALTLLGRRLELSLTNDTSNNAVLGPLEVEEISETISLLAELIHAQNRRTSASGPAGSLTVLDTDVLAEASRGISGDKDILLVVCDIMDYYLQDGVLEDDAGIAVLQSCISFLQAALYRSPSRVWSYMARSELLNSGSQGGKLSKLMGNLDLVLERYDFLLSTVRLLSSMVDVAMSSAVQRKCGDGFAYRNRGSNMWAGIADRVLEKVCYAISQAAVDILQNSFTWRFGADIQRIGLVSEVVPILSKLISFSHSIDDRKGPEKLSSCLQTASAYVLDCFLSPSTGSLRFQALLVAFASTLKSQPPTLLPGRRTFLSRQLEAVADLVKIILRAAVYTGQMTGLFGTLMFKSCTLIVRLAAVSDAYKDSAIQLLDVMISTAGKASTEPPSLSGYLGPQIAKSFLQYAGRLDKPFSSAPRLVTSWKFLSSIVSNRQQWLANCLLTGKTPREGLKSEKGVMEPSSNSVLLAALENLKCLESLEPSEALATLQFVTTALNHWPRTIIPMQKNTSFLDGLRKYVRDLKPASMTAKSDAVKASIEAKLASYIADIFAMQLYHLRQMGKAQDLSSKLVNDIDYYLRDAALVSGYNTSLHTNFTKNFANKYPGCALEGFKRTLLEEQNLGTAFYYDLERANDMLKFDPGWHNHRNGFRSEMELANANLSLVDSQLSLFKSWEMLLLELGSCFKGTPTIAKQMVQVAQQCLTANQEHQGPECIFLRIVQARVNLALMLVQRLAGTALASAEINELLRNIFGTFNSVEEPFSAQSIAYTRSLLKLLYVTLRAFHASYNAAAPKDESNAKVMLTMMQTVLNILDRIVGRGFRTLVSFIHDTDANVAPEDLALLTAILQAIISLPTMDQSQTQILNIMAGHDAPRVATSLFSWADKLAIQADPIYGELSVVFLLELSTLPIVAEQLACDGILGNILSANIINAMRRGNSSVSPTTDSVTGQRLYGIWAKGMLPLLLNLLTALGATVATEVAYFLNQFPHLLQSSIDRFEAPGISRTASKGGPRYLTLLSVSEMHSLALITKILDALRANNSRDIPLVQWDAPVALENVEYWLTSRRLLRERLLPLGSREAELAGIPTGNQMDGEMGGSGSSESRLEERAVMQLEAVKNVLSEEVEE